MKDKIKQVNDLCAANGTYLNQHGKKTGNPAEQDINKAIIHLQRELKQLEDYAVLYQPRSQASDRFDSDGGCESFR